MSPWAVVIADALCVALMSTLPLRETAVPAEREAVVVTLEMTTATAGATETPVEEAPVFASVVSALLVVALTLSAPPPSSVPSSAAVVVSSISAIATEAPMPTSPAPTVPPAAGSAVVLIVELDWAAMITAPEPLMVRSPATSALVSRRTMWIATETLRPSVPPPPAPLVVVAPKTWVEAIVALTVAPLALTLAPAGSSALLVTRT